MSRIGKKPVTVPENVQIQIENHDIKVKGPKGELALEVHPKIKVEQKDNQIIVSRVSDSKSSRSLHGLFRNLIYNMIIGVCDGYKKELELKGVGYRAALGQTEGGKQKLTLSIGFSHTVDVVAEEGINFNVNKNIITIEGIDKHLVGQTAAKIRSLRPPEPYKGKGIRYVGEVVRKKVGKAVVKTSV
ncbi:MAG: 50S ribosomal protein L6 [Candidatus Berkelbacteria bacterium]|nr:50S ribosomal protein L6 [Candidatus Berkelbacteria bacterium]